MVRNSCSDSPVCPIFGTVWYDDFNLKPRKVTRSFHRNARTSPSSTAMSLIASGTRWRAASHFFDGLSGDYSFGACLRHVPHYWALAVFFFGGVTILILWLIDSWNLGTFRVSRNRFAVTAARNVSCWDCFSFCRCDILEDVGTHSIPPRQQSLV